ncbi:MAG: ATP-binding protein [Oligoflexus sp.]|nr:ATP-binding protein [Oligoflexus sp.]
MYKRIASSKLNEWFHSKRRKPLLIRGARQVGKTTLVRQYAADHGLELIEINLERFPNLICVFKHMTVEPVLSEIYALNRKARKDPSQSLVFIDEIQAIPEAIQWLRYAFEDRPDIAIVGAGSLLEFALKDATVSMPVGRVEFLWLYPMNFREYLIASKNEFLEQLLQNTNLENIELFPQSSHLELNRLMRDYCMVGGMPEVVGAFLDSGPQGAINAQVALITSYLDDLSKYTKKHPLTRLQRIFRSIPGIIGNRVKYVSLSREEQSREIKDVIELLTIAGITIPIFHSDASGIPLAATENQNSFKLLFLDIGLAFSVLGLDWVNTQRLTDEKFVNEGQIAEQFAGQELMVSENSQNKVHLNFWKRDKAQSEAEVDYVIEVGNKIFPIEVKAGPSGSMRSLHQFMLKNRELNNVALRLHESKPTITKVSHAVLNSDGQAVPIEYRLLSLPLYMTSEARRILMEIVNP